VGAASSREARICWPREKKMFRSNCSSSVSRAMANDCFGSVMMVSGTGAGLCAATLGCSVVSGEEFTLLFCDNLNSVEWVL